MGRPDYIFGQFRCAARGRGLLCFRTTACFLLTSGAWSHFRERQVEWHGIQIWTL